MDAAPTWPLSQQKERNVAVALFMVRCSTAAAYQPDMLILHSAAFAARRG